MSSHCLENEMGETSSFLPVREERTYDSATPPEDSLQS